MYEQKENYIVLKGVSEKFNEVAKSLSDEDVLDLIKERLRCKIDEQISELDFKWNIQEIIEKYIQENSFKIENMIQKSLENKFK